MEDPTTSAENLDIEKHYQCEQCSFTTEFHTELIRHGLVHTDTQTFLGNISDTNEDTAADKGNGNTPGNGSGIDDDKRRLFHCDTCNFSSPFRSKIVSHCVVHSDARPFICDLCEYAAKRKYDLKKHMHFKHKVLQSGFLPLPNHPPADTSSIQFVSNQYPVSEHDTQLTATNASYSNEATQYSKTLPSVKMETGPNEDDCYIIDERLSVRDSFHNTSMLNLSNITLNKQTISDYQEQASKSLVSAAQQQNTTAAEVHISVPELSKPSSRFFSPRPTGLFSNVDLVLEQTPPQSHEHGLSPPTLLSGTLNLTKDVGVTSAVAETSSYSITTVSSSNVTEAGVGTSRSFTCPHCNILYFDNALYVMHMGLHDPDNPWQCNLCGDIYHDVYSFTSHFINQHRQ